MSIHSESNNIYIHGEIAADDFLRVLAAMHSITKQRGYSDLVLDFSNCSRVYAPNAIHMRPMP